MGSKALWASGDNKVQMARRTEFLGIRRSAYSKCRGIYRHATFFIMPVKQKIFDAITPD